jgi:hypothetical protein
VVILKLTGRRKALTRNFDEVKQQIRNKLYRDKRTDAMEQFVKNLRDKANIKIDESKLAKVQIEGVQQGQFPGPGVPPPGPGQFHPGAPGTPQATPAMPGNPAGSQQIALPPAGGPTAPTPPTTAPTTPPPPAETKSK